MTRVTRLLDSYLVVVLLLSGTLSLILLPASRAHAQTLGAISLVNPLTLSPASPAVNQTTTATFTVQNTGGQAITAQAFVAGARNPSNANVDFPGTGAVTLQPGQQYTYSASRSFATSGNYSAWPAYFDGTNWIQLAAPTTFTVGNPTPGTISLVTPLALSPASPAMNQNTTATFTVQNTGGQAITAQAFVAGARDPSNANVDFPGTGAVTLQPGQQFTYSASRSFATSGTNYSAWPAYFDGANWFELDVNTSFTVTTGTGGAACNLPWGGTIPDGQTVTAYQSSSGTCGNTCTSQTRTCTNGTLSGSYTYSSCTPPTGCTTLTVAKDGSGQYSTISAAAVDAQPGYEILIKAGTYNEKVTPPRSGTETGGYITFRAEQTGAAIITNPGGPCIDVSGVNYLKFTGLTLDHCNAAAGSDPCCGPTLSGALQIRGPSHHIVADGLAITSSTGSGVYMIGVGSNTVHDITVQNSSITNSVGHGVFVYRACAHITVDHNMILHSGQDVRDADAFGLEIRTEDSNKPNDGGRQPSYIFLTNNEVGYSPYQGSRTWNVDHVLFQGNHIHHSGATGIQIESGTQFCILDGNRVEHNSWNFPPSTDGRGKYVSETGIWIDRSMDCVVRNNQSTANNIGIWVGDDNDRVIVRNNISYLNDGSSTQDFPEGIRLNGDPHPPLDSQHVTLVHNTMYKNGNNNSESYNLVLLGSTARTNLVVSNNIVSDVVGATNVSAATGYTMSNGCYWNPAVSGPGDNAAITQNPLFVNAAGADFRLQTGSPCIDKGAFLTYATTSGSGTSLTVADSRYFIDGYDGVTAGDVIRVGGNTATITHVSGNTLTLDQSINWSAGDKVSYPYTGSAPDIGALESP